MKKTIALLMSVCLLLCMSALTSCNLDIPLYAPNGLQYIINADGKTCTIVGIGKCTDTEVAIPESILKLPVTVIGQDAFCDQKQITKVTIPEGIVQIENSAFMYCTGLTEIILPNSLVQAGTYSFGFCDNLRSIQFSKNLTEIPVQMFYMCKSLEEVIIPDSVKVIGDGAFAECPLKSVTLGSGIEKVENFGLMNHGTYGFQPLTVTYNGTLAQWQNVERGGRWIQEIDCTFSCQDFSGNIMDVYE